MYIHKYSIKLVDLPPKGYNILGSLVFSSNNSDSPMGEIIEYNKRKHIAVISLFNPMDELDLPNNAFNLEYIATS